MSKYEYKYEYICDENVGLSIYYSTPQSQLNFVNLLKLSNLSDIESFIMRNK